MVIDYNNLNQLTTRSGGGVIPVRGKVSKPSNVAVNGKAANVDTNNVPWKFWAQVPVEVGTNQFSIVAKDGSGNATTNQYQLVISGGAANSYQYDANGNLLSDGARTYSWDAENRLASVTANGNTSEFTYDGLGRRVKEKVNGTLTKQWVWSSALAEERDGNNNVTKRFYAQGEEIGGTPYYYTVDHLGSIREMGDANGNVVAQYQYDSWGRKTKISGSMDSDFGFAGYYFHANSGLNLTFYRAYDSDTGRWLSRDPIGEDGGMNLYGYCYNDSINYLDPFGLDLASDLESYKFKLEKTQEALQKTMDYINQNKGKDASGVEKAREISKDQMKQARELREKIEETQRDMKWEERAKGRQSCPTQQDPRSPSRTPKIPWPAWIRGLDSLIRIPIFVPEWEYNPDFFPEPPGIS